MVYLLVKTLVTVGSPLALKLLFTPLVGALEPERLEIQVLVNPCLVVRQLLAARVHLATPWDQTHPLKPQRLFLMQLLVPLQRQRVGQDCSTPRKVAPEITSNHALLVVEHMAPHIVCASKRGIASLHGAPDP